MECGNCTICCRDLNIVDTDSKEGEYCKHCDINVGCKIYDERPEGCRIFECCWKQMNVVADDLRPDKCGVLFEKYSNKLIVGSTEDDLSDLILGQINFFNREGISVLIVNQIKKTRHFYLTEGDSVQSVEEDIKCRDQTIRMI